jgi:glycosyltransferase involved in cell wall biosynthesis
MDRSRPPEVVRARLHVGVLVDRHDPRRGGLEQSLAALVIALEHRGHVVEVFTEAANADAPGRVHLVRPRGWTRRGRTLSFAERAPRAARAAGCDVVVACRHVVEADLLWLHGGAHAVSVRAQREARLGRPLTALRLSGRHAAYHTLERAALAGGVRLVVVPSQRVHDELRNVHGAALRVPVEVAPNTVDGERFHPREREGARHRLRTALSLPPEAPLVVLAARDPALKGARELVRAAALLEVPAAVLVAGPADAAAWERRSRRELVRAGGVAERVLVRPHCDPLDLAAGADVAALPTWRDTGSLAALEALAAGTPVVTTERNGAAETLDDPALLVRIGDPSRIAALAAAVDRLLVASLAPGAAATRRRWVGATRDPIEVVADRLEELARPARDH